jgi:hypothetical protein
MDHTNNIVHQHRMLDNPLSCRPKQEGEVEYCTPDKRRQKKHIHDADWASSVIDRGYRLKYCT